MSNNISELDKARLDLAWKWFDHHAKQRTSFFNFFLIITGILLNAYVIAIRDDQLLIAFMICITGIFQSLAFITFDCRGRQLVTHSEDVIEKIERSTLFTNDFFDPAIKNGEQLGLLIVERIISMREGVRRGLLKNLFKMKTGIRVMQCVVLLLFVISLVNVVLKIILHNSPLIRMSELLLQ